MTRSRLALLAAMGLLAGIQHDMVSIEPRRKRPVETNTTTEPPLIESRQVRRARQRKEEKGNK